jgi:hypothetical protein
MLTRFEWPKWYHDDSHLSRIKCECGIILGYQTGSIIAPVGLASRRG